MSSFAHGEQEKLNRLAEESGVAVIALDRNGGELFSANNNSICRSLLASEEFRPRCGEFCGKAFENAHSAGGPVEYICHAGLFCRAVPQQSKDSDLVLIVGRTFTRAEGYRNATERAISGEWAVFSPADFFDNVLMSGSADMVRNTADDAVALLPATTPPDAGFAVRDDKDAAVINPAATIPPAESSVIKERAAAESDAAEIRSMLASLMGLSYEAACDRVLRHLSKAVGRDSLVWLEQEDTRFRSVAGIGRFTGYPVNVNMPAASARLVRAADEGNAIELKERDAKGEPRKLLLYPVRVGSDIRAAIGIQTSADDNADLTLVGKLTRVLGPQIEILRLRHQVSESGQVAAGLRRLNESLKRIDSDDFWLQVTRVSAELLGAERASLLTRDEASGTLVPKAAIGSVADLHRTDNIGGRIAGYALETGQPLIVANIFNSGISPSPADWRYKTQSFISYPIMIGDRRLGVMNFTDRADGTSFTESDVEVLNSIAPQIAVAIDRGKLKVLAGELEKRSITDPLTGLMNRGYIEERLAEEMNRASRYRFPASLLMIDVDHFKSYNDSYGHPAGDVALRLVAQALKRTLRAADVAARYGGEEFSVLLPQTPAEEASIIAERIRQRVERTEFPKRQVTISVGVAGFSTEFTEPKDWITAADMALYEAKEEGRNRVIRYEDMGRSFREKIN